MVPRVGVEPTRLTARDFESLVYTNFTTEAYATNAPKMGVYATAHATTIFGWILCVPRPLLYLNWVRLYLNWAHLWSLVIVICPCQRSAPSRPCTHPILPLWSGSDRLCVRS